MPPFTKPTPLVSGLKDKPESLVVQGDRLYVGSATGNVLVYSLEAGAKLLETKHVAKRAVDQLGVLKDLNSLVVLSDMVITLYTLPSLDPPTVLAQAKAAFSFVIHSSVQHLSEDDVPTLVTLLVAGCRRKAVIYTWHDGEAQETKEVAMPHSARVMSFIDPHTISMAYSPTEFAVLSLTTMTVTDVVLTNVTAAAGRFTGYMTLGLGAKTKPIMTSVGDERVLIVKDHEGTMFGKDAKSIGQKPIEWPAPPEDITFVKPYILTILPPGTVPLPMSTNTLTPSFIPNSVLQVRSTFTNTPSQTIAFPFSSPSSSPAPADPSTNTTVAPSSIRLLSASNGVKPPIYFVTISTDRTTANNEGSTIWSSEMKPWSDQLDELVIDGKYAEALALLDCIDDALLPDKENRRLKIRAVHAVARFKEGAYADAINTFIALDVNPAKVVALYPEKVSGRLVVPEEEWIQLHGGPPPPKTPAMRKIVERAITAHSIASLARGEGGAGGGAETPGEEKANSDFGDVVAAASGGFKGRLSRGLGGYFPGVSGLPKDDDTASIKSTSSRKMAPEQRAVHSDLNRSIEALLQFLSDRRPKVGGLLSTMGITPAQSPSFPLLSTVSPQSLFSQPNTALSNLTPDELVRVAQVVDTALFKAYLVVRPGLVGPLCRVANWCEVTEVEEELRERGKFSDLIDLYNGKKMHGQALTLLRQLSESEDDLDDKLRPSISYLQKLGSEHLEHIFDASRWLFEADKERAMEVFKSEDVELPRLQVADFLKTVSDDVCAKYIEYLIHEREEDGSVFHDRLAELYLGMTVEAKKTGHYDAEKTMYAKLLKFVEESQRIRVDRMYAKIASFELYEARAVLLGRLGRHDQALELYVYKLGDYAKAEEYCKRLYRTQDVGAPKIFLTLLRIYLRPSVKTTSDLLTPALDLICRHSPRLDASETLAMIPPLVTTHEIHAFLTEALRAPVFDTMVMRNIAEARKEEIERRLMGLQKKRVRVTDARHCPQCKKRIGNSVIAVHAPRGEVTHYQCREAFAAKLKELSV